MKLKYLSLLVIFILNISATVIADSTHFHGSIEKIELSSGEDHFQHSTHDETNPCEEQFSCHAGHIHEILWNELALTFSLSSSEYNFPQYLTAIISIPADIIKPPTL